MFRATIKRAQAAMQAACEVTPPLPTPVEPLAPRGLEDWINPAMLEAEYAVRGRLVARSDEIKKELAKGSNDYPFEKIIACNIGNPQAMLQKPVTYYRQVAALVNCPWMLDEAHGIPADAVRRAKEMIAAIGHANMTGAYTGSLGYEWVRANLAEALERRDGVSAKPENIFLTDGASPGIKLILGMLISTPDCGVMLPIPQYPLYTAAITVQGGAAVPYHLSEDGEWSLDMEAMRTSVQDARDSGVEVKAVTIINPGNPTGHVLSRDQVREVCQFAEENGLVVLADEVYQENIYSAGKEFVSFKSVMAREFPALPLVSFHSVSKGVIGECGRRGGYMEVCNFPQLAMDTLVKMSSISLCPNVNGQIMVDLMMNPPVEGDESYESWAKEYYGLHGSMKERAVVLYDGLNGIKGIKTNPIEGAMYAFPSLSLPESFIKEAASKGMHADEYWCGRVLEETGILLVPGSGFGQRKGTYHFRITLLPPMQELEKVYTC